MTEAEARASQCLIVGSVARIVAGFAMDEATAKTKWCPMVRFDRHVSNDTSTMSNRISVGTHSAYDEHCLASDCMIWTWLNPQHTDGQCGLMNFNSK